MISFAANRIIDTVFFVDVLITFFMPYRTSALQGAIWVRDRQKIARHYLRTWFLPDMITCVPFDVIIGATLDSSQSSSVETGHLRMVRMIRVLKLVRIVRATRILKRWQDNVAISYSVSTLVRFVLLTLVLAHWLACLWGILGTPPRESTAVVSDLVQTPDGGPNWSGRYGDGLTWIQKYRLEGLGAWELYTIALYVSLNNIFGGSSEINPANTAEFSAQCIMLLLGSSVWAYVIGSACGIIATLDPASIEYRQTIDELNFFCADQMIPEDLRVELRAYFRSMLYQIRLRRYEGLLGRMSQKLRGDAAYCMCELRVRKVPYLVHPSCEPEFLSNLAIKFAPVVFSHLERVPCTRLLIVGRGVVAKRGRLGVSGTALGQDVILSNANLRDVGDAIALTFVQSSTLEQKDIFSLLPSYPMAYTVVRRAAMRIALVRAISKAARIAKRARLNARDEEEGSSVLFEALERALSEPLYPVIASAAEPVGRNRRSPFPVLGQAAPARLGASSKGLWSSHSHVPKPLTTDERIDELRREMRETNGEVLERIDQLEALLRKAIQPSTRNPGAGQEAQRSRGGGFSALFGGFGGTATHEVVEVAADDDDETRNGNGGGEGV